MNQDQSPDIDRSAAQERSVYDSRNWLFKDIHDGKFEARVHQLELSIKSQQQTFNETDLHLLFCLFNFTAGQKEGVVKEIENIDAFYSFFKYYIDEVILAESMKSEQFFNQMKNLQSGEVFNRSLTDLVENRLVYCGFITYRTDTEKNLKKIRFFETTGSLYVTLVLQLQKYYREMKDRYQREFPNLDSDIHLDPDQRELLIEYVRDIPVDTNLNLVKLMDLFQEDDKVYRFIFPNNSYLYVHPQALLLLPDLARKKILEVYRYYFMRRSVEAHIQKMMDGIFKEINSFSTSGKVYTQEELYKLFQEERLDEESVLPWYYWSKIISEKLSKQISMKDNMKKYYQAAYFFQCFLHNRAQHIDNFGEDLDEKKDVKTTPKAEPISVSETIADFNKLLNKMHEIMDFYSVDSLQKLGASMGFKEKYDAPEPDGYVKFIQQFIEKTTTMISKTTNQPHLMAIPVRNETDEFNFYVVTADLAGAFFHKRDVIAADFGLYYSEIFSYPDNPIQDEDSFIRHVEEFTASREALFYKVYSFYLRDIFAQLAGAQDLNKIEKLFVNRKSDAPRSLAQILDLDFKDLISMRPTEDTGISGSSDDTTNQFQEEEIHQAGYQAEFQSDNSDDQENAVSSSVKNKGLKNKKKSSFGQWIMGFFTWLANIFKPKNARKKPVHRDENDNTPVEKKKSWREELGKSFTKAMDKDLQSKKHKAQKMKDFLTGGKPLTSEKGTKSSSSVKGRALNAKEILKVIGANVLDNCGLSKLPLDEAMERLQDEWNDPMVIAVPDMIKAEKEKRLKTVKKRLNEILHKTRFNLNPSDAEAEIIGKAREICGYADFAAMLKRDDLKVYMEWYITLFIVDKLIRDLEMA